MRKIYLRGFVCLSFAGMGEFTTGSVTREVLQWGSSRLTEPPLSHLIIRRAYCGGDGRHPVEQAKKGRDTRVYLFKCN